MKKEMTNMQAAKKTIKLFIDYKGKKYFIFTILFSLFLAIFLYIEPLIINEVLQKIESFYNTGNLEINKIMPILIGLIIYSIISVILSFIYNYYIFDVPALRWHINTAVTYLKRIIKLDYGEYLNKKPGSIYKNFDRGIDGQLFFMQAIMLDVLRVLFGVLTTIVVIFIINWKLAIGALSMLPVIIFMGIFFNKKTAEKQNEVNKSWDKTFGHFGETLTNLAVVKTLKLESLFEKKFENETNYALENQYSISKRWQLAAVYMNGLTTFSRAIILIVGIFMIQSGEIGIATLLVFYMYLNYIYWPLNYIFSQLKNIQTQLSRSKKFFQEFDNIKLDNDNPNSKNIENIDGKIEFKDVSFSYNKDKQTLKNINFTINPGEKIAFVGNTGAGKTTITNLIIRFWEINSGKILLDGQDTSQINKESLRENIGLVMQDNTLFNDTIRENLLYAKSNATEQELINAIKLAKADFVLKLEDGLDTIIGERGLKLSGGEKQRLSIARIILKNPQILILDEATSALDNKTEVEVKKSLDNLMKGKTSIIIAHRLSTVQNADKILVLENGEVVEAGKYEELMNKKGKFYSIANPDRLVIV
ncbi:MAG: ABC transporter ATP-binding protein/permease [Candidatus Gracilibacteria bacterium]|nr:ABC transporter ATP-binding protein/permease [Candidatus Gracilibacteria bacterium]